MTSTSVGTRTPEPAQSFHATPCGNSDGSCLSNPPGILAEGSVEAWRVKKFAGQQTFKAPAAEDFAKGMPSHQAPTPPGSNLLAKAGAAVIKAVKALVGGNKS